MLGIIRLLLRFVWLAVMVLGARQLVEYAQQGVDKVVSQIESGETTGPAGILMRLHDAAHRRRGHDIPSGDVVGEL